MKRTLLFLLLLLCSTLAKAQTLLERIVDSILIKERREFLMSKKDSVFICVSQEFIRPFEAEDIVIYEVYNCHTREGFGNVVDLNKGLIDTTSFTKEYFVTGKFLEDWIVLKEQGKALLDNTCLIHPFVFDTVKEKAYSYISPKPILVEIQQKSMDIDTVYSRFGYEIKERPSQHVFIGKLFKAKTIELMFFYPTFVSIDDVLGGDSGIRWKWSCCFALKENHFFYIDLVNEKIYPMEEVVENHWDWITNVIEKQ